MRITKDLLKKIIKEEIKKIDESAGIIGRPSPFDEYDPAEDPANRGDEPIDQEPGEFDGKEGTWYYFTDGKATFIPKTEKAGPASHATRVGSSVSANPEDAEYVPF